MNLDDAKRFWRESASDAPAIVGAMVGRVRQAEQFKAALRTRDWRETVAALVVVALFSSSLFALRAWIPWLGALLIVLDAIAIIGVLHWNRLADGPTPLDAPLVEYCRLEIARVDRQIKLLRAVALWYVVPLMLGFCMIFLGQAGVSAFSISVCLFAFGFGWFVHWLNQRAVRLQLSPLRQSLSDALHELGEPPVKTPGPR